MELSILSWANCPSKPQISKQAKPKYHEVRNVIIPEITSILIATTITFCLNFCSEFNASIHNCAACFLVRVIFSCLNQMVMKQSSSTSIIAPVISRCSIASSISSKDIPDLSNSVTINSRVAKSLPLLISPSIIISRF